MVKHLAYKRATTRNGRGEAEAGFDLIKTGSDNSDALNWKLRSELILLNGILPAEYPTNSIVFDWSYGNKSNPLQ